MKKLIAVLLVLMLVFIAGKLLQAQVPTPGNWLYDYNENKIDDRIENIAAEHPDSLVDMIIDLRHHPEEMDVDLLRHLGEVSYIGEYLNLIAIRRLPAETAYPIADNINVVMVELDEKVYMNTATSVRAIRARQSTTYSPNTAWEAGFRGQGINIAILDTGVDDDHPSLDDMDDNASTTNDNKFVAGYDATANPRVETNPDDDNTHYYYYGCVKGDVFHGTHVAGIALGTGGGTDNIGVAPEAKLIDVKVLDHCGTGKTSDIIAGIEWCIKNRNTAWAGETADYHGIDVLNLSLGGSNSDGQDAMSRAVNKAVDMGLVVCCAVGNNDLTNTIITPAAADKAIAVGSVNDKNTVNRSDDIISSHQNWGSNRGPRKSDNDADDMDELKPDVTAYGTAINSCNGINPGQNATGWQVHGGTSMATPHVAGVCALILEANPHFLPHDVKNVLRSTAEDRNGASYSYLDPNYDVDFGWGIVNAHEAVTTTNVPPDLWISRKPVWWSSQDIWTADDPEVGVPNTIYAKVHNTSGTSASNVDVRFQVGIFGIGQPNWIWSQTTTINIGGVDVQTASVSWTPTSQILVKGPQHACIRVEILHNPDPNIENNMAQKNLATQEATSTAVFEFRGWNPFDMPSRVFFGLDKVGLPIDWDAHLMYDGEFELNYGEFIDNSAFMAMSMQSQTGDTGTVFIYEYRRGAIEPFGGVECSLKNKDAKAKLAMDNMMGSYGDTLSVPLSITTEYEVGLAQFVVDYNSEIANFIGAELGPDAQGFNIMSETELPFPPSTAPFTNSNFLVQLNGGGMRTITGDRQLIAFLNFMVVDSIPEHHTALIFDRGPEQTFLTTVNLEDLRGDDLGLFDGGIGVMPAKQPLTVMVQYDLIDPPRPVNDMDVQLTQSNGEILNNVTNEEGICVFDEVERGDVKLEFAKEGDTRNAITGADALLILKYLAFMETLTEPQMFAADVTLDEAVTGSDALAVLRHLAFFPSVNDYTSTWAATPQPIPEPANEGLIIAHAYLLGDVTLSWGEEQSGVKGNNAARLSKSRNESNIFFNTKSTVRDVDGNMLLPVTVQTKGENLNTCVFSVEYNPDILEYQSVLKTEATRDFMIAANDIEHGKIHIAMAGVSGISKNTDILKLAFKPKDNNGKDYTVLSFTNASVNDIQIKECSKSQVQVTKSGIESPQNFQLEQNYPNPFNGETIIKYNIPNINGRSVDVKLNIYNLNGQLVCTLVNEKKSSGFHSTIWNGRDNFDRTVATGMYFYKMEVADFKSIKKLTILK